MTTQYSSKIDFKDTIIGIENYPPGIPTEQPLSLNISSGTTGKSISMVVYKLFEARDSSEHYKVFKYDSIKSFVRLVTKSAQSLRSTLIQLSFRKARRVLCLDENDLAHPQIINLLKQFEPEYFVGTSTRVEKMLRELDSNNQLDSIKSVKYFRLSSEIIIDRQLKLIDTLCPKDEILSDYGLAETDNVAFTCSFLNKKYSDRALRVYHPFKDICSIEIIEKDELGYGEIIATTQTTGVKNYKTGDMGKLVKETCACGSSLTLFVEGRKDFDVVHCAGATLLANSIDQVFLKFEKEVADYQVDVREKVTSKNIQGEILFRIVPKDPSHPPDTAFLVKKISSLLQVTKSRTLAQLIESNIFTQPYIEYVEAIPGEKEKKIRLRKIDN